MVTATEVGQLSGECSLWRDTLRSFRTRFSKHQSLLLQIVASQTQRDVLLEIEHLHNQFHIQLINIHDLRHSIKRHMSKISHERSTRGHLSDDTLARHEFLYDDYHRLDTTLHLISREFDRFVKYIDQQK
jgi:hypothetical protein